MPGIGWKLGLAPGLGINYHNSAIQQLPNGDMVAAYYNTPDREDDPDQTILIMRRRAGAEDWDMPEPFPIFADAALAAPVFWRDTKFPNKLWLFWGFPRLIGAGPFCYATSTDNGATWSQGPIPQLPRENRPLRLAAHQQRRPRRRRHHLSPHRLHRPRRRRQRLHQRSLGTRDEGQTWFDTGGRTAGRHTTLVLARNGDLLGFGGKNSNIEGRMPLARSSDGGKTWKKSKTPFDQLLSGERPSVIRLASGRLFFTADFNPKNEKHIHKDGAYVALSDDDGATGSQNASPTRSSPSATPPPPRAPTASSTSSPRRTSPTMKSSSTKPGCSTNLRRPRSPPPTAAPSSKAPSASTIRTAGSCGQPPSMPAARPAKSASPPQWHPHLAEAIRRGQHLDLADLRRSR